MFLVRNRSFTEIYRTGGGLKAFPTALVVLYFPHPLHVRCKLSDYWPLGITTLGSSFPYPLPCLGSFVLQKCAGSPVALALGLHTFFSDSRVFPSLAGDGRRCIEPGGTHFASLPSPLPPPGLTCLHFYTRPYSLGFRIINRYRSSCSSVFTLV